LQGNQDSTIPRQFCSQSVKLGMSG